MRNPFRRAALGADVPHNKNTAQMETVVMPLPSKIVLPMGQHIGAPATPVVAKGDRVYVGSVVGRANGFVSADIHSGVSGVVEGLTTLTAPNGAGQSAVVIVPDGNQTISPDVRPPVVVDLPSFQQAVRSSGLVGLGGAGFPAAIKLAPKNLDEIDTLVINGAECEPYITSDNRCMQEDTDFILDGIRAVMRYLDIPRCVIGIEGNKPEEIDKLTAAAADMPVEVKCLPETYPQGAEKVLVETCTGREVPFPGLPSDVGVIVLNVTSVAFIGKHLKTGMPLITKRLTVDGDIVKRPGNVEVIIGTPIRELLEFCGGLTEKPGKVLYGGPMMGICVADLDQPVLKNNNAILALSRGAVQPAKTTNCIHCGRCANACPLGLSSKEIVAAYLKRDTALLARLNADLCMSCGTCTFVCPAKRPLAQNIALAKLLMKNGGKK
ncbi:MAG: electron transport complex subunit RsxC [Oscillospiraceae bacterium]|nr:electron transport complex subunit RsxC [Oscillospiraceae bacterium]